MSIFDKFYNFNPDKPFPKNFKIADRLYSKLEYLKSIRYANVSINLLVMEAISHLLENINGELTLTEQNVDLGYHSRSFRIKPSLNNKLLETSKKYNIPVNRLVNIAIAEALKSESEYLKDYKEYPGD